MKKTDLAWLAGFFDGEGYVGIRHEHHTRWVLTIVIANTHAESIRRIKELVGAGHVRVDEQRSRRACYLWTISARSAERFLRAIQPFIVTKREQVALALAAVQLRKRAPRMPVGFAAGGPRISPETNAQLASMRDQLKLLKRA